MRAAAGWHGMSSALHFGRAVNHWSSAVRVYDFHQRARGTYFTVAYPLFCPYLKRETQTKLSLGNTDRGAAENSFSGTWWYSKAGSQGHISECCGDGGLGRRCASRQGILYSSSKLSVCSDFWQLESKWKLMAEVSGSWEGWLLLQEPWHRKDIPWATKSKKCRCWGSSARTGVRNRPRDETQGQPHPLVPKQGQREGSAGTAEPRVGDSRTCGCPGVAQGKAEDSHLKWGWEGARRGCPGHLNPFSALGAPKYKSKPLGTQSHSSCSRSGEYFHGYTPKGVCVFYKRFLDLSAPISCPPCLPGLEDDAALRVKLLLE